MLTSIKIVFVIICLLRLSIQITTPGSTIRPTTINPCEAMYGCLNDADCDDEGACICKQGFTGSTCAGSALTELNTRVVNQLSNSDLNQAKAFTSEAQAMMDNQLRVSYSGIKDSVETTNEITRNLITLIENTDILADEGTVDLFGLTQDITEMTTDILQGTMQAENSMTSDELKEAVIKAEENLLIMTNLMVDKRSTDNSDSAAIDTADMSVRVMKAKGRNLPLTYSGRDGGFSLPYYETFQDKKRKKNVTINVVAYRESPYRHVDNPESIGISVVKLQVQDKNGKKEKDIKDGDDPLEIFIGGGKKSEALPFDDMVESRADTGVYMSHFDTNETASGMMIEIKLTSLKICDMYGRYNGYPDQFDFDMWVQTKGKSRIMDKHPLDLRASYKDQILRITLEAEEKSSRSFKPVYITASCEDDRADTAKRRKKRSGLSLVKHQFKASMLSIQTLDENGKKWQSSKKLKDVGVDSEGQILFKSHFFGTFSADMFFIGPTTIDFSALFANFTSSIEETPHALAAIITILVIVALLTVLLHRLDKTDELMWKFLPLVNNKPSASVTYYLAVETSVTSAKQIKSSVYINIIGKDGTSGTRKLEDGQRTNFSRGTSSHFEMRLDKDLGELDSVQIWHNNIDGKTAWHLRKITVIKAENGNRYTFLCGKWLSINSEDGKTWRSLDALDAENVKTDTLFFSLSQKKIFDDHLWISLFKRPHFSRFTRVQRLWCLVALLFLAMISSAMWYDTPEDKAMQTISVGPLKLNYKQFYVGLMSSLIALGPSLILVLLFRNRKFKGEKNSGCHLPWWSVFFAYFLVFVCVGASATFVFLYSLQWGSDKTVEWMISFVLAVCQSIMFLEPVKAMLLAMVVACLFKKAGSRELTSKGMVIPGNPEKPDDVEKADGVEMQSEDYPEYPGTKEETDEQIVARINAQIDKRMWSKFKLWFGILLYVILVTLISSHSNVNMAFLQNNHILQTLSSSYSPNTTDEIYDWIRTTFTRAVYPKWWESEDDEMLRPAYTQWFILNAYNYRITRTRFRQVRVNGECSGPEATQNSVEKCTPSFKSENEEKGNFCPLWEPLNETGCFDENEEFHYAFHYNFGHNKNAGDLSYSGSYGTYGPDGYYIDLGPKQSLVLHYVTLLQTCNWIDDKTRAVFLDVVTYNANTRLFSNIKIVFEIPSFGGVTMTKVVWSANLYPYINAIDYLILLLQIIYIIVWLVRFIFFVIDLCKNRTKVLFTISFYLRLLELGLGATAIICCILRIDATISSIASLKMTIGRYASFEQIRVYEVAYQGCLAGVLFIITLDLLKPLEFNYHFFMLTSALKIARTAICAFLFIIVIEVIAFSSLLNLTIGNSHELFKSMQDSMNTLLTVLLAMMSYTSEHFNDIVTKLYFGLYTMTVTITLVNVFIVILTISFNDVKTEIEKGNLYFDEKLNIHFWNKIHAGLQWIQDRLCFSCLTSEGTELEKLYGHTRRLRCITRNMEQDDKIHNQMIAKVLIKMLEIDGKSTKLQCLNVQRNQFSIKYIFGFLKTGETLLILNVPTLSCAVEVHVECFLVPRFRREIRKKFRTRLQRKLVGNAFSLFTQQRAMIKGSVQVEIIGTADRYSTYNTIVTQLDKTGTWKLQPTCESKTGVVASMPTVPLQIATIETDVDTTYTDGWNPVETYIVPREGGTFFPSYNANAKITFQEDSFDDQCSVSLRTRDGNFTSVMNVELDVPTQKAIDVELPIVPNSVNHKGDNLAKFIISVRNSPNEDWERLNSVLKHDNETFQFSYLPARNCTNVDFTVQKWKIYELLSDRQVDTKNDSDLLQAFVMVSKVREIADQWRVVAGSLGIHESDIGEPKDRLSKEEKCFLLLTKWQEKTKVTLPILTLFLTSLGFRVVAENIRKKWLVNSPEQLLHHKGFPKRKLNNMPEKNKSDTDDKL